MPHMQRAARRGRGEAASGCGGWGRAPRKPPQPPAPPATPNHRWRRAQQLQKPQTGGRAVAPGSFLYNVKDGYQGSFSTHRDFCLPFLGLVYRGWGGGILGAPRVLLPHLPQPDHLCKVPVEHGLERVMGRDRFFITLPGSSSNMNPTSIHISWKHTPAPATHHSPYQ